MTGPGSRSSRRRPGELVPIHSDSPRRILVGAAIMLLTACGQVVGLLRHLRRLPDDAVGIGLYIATAGWLLLMLLLMAALLLRRWTRVRGGSD